MDLFHGQHFVEHRRQEHEIDAGERLLRVGHLTRVLQRVLQQHIEKLEPTFRTFFTRKIPRKIARKFLHKKISAEKVL
jgi:hypothetical protein